MLAGRGWKRPPAGCVGGGGVILDNSVGNDCEVAKPVRHRSVKAASVGSTPTLTADNAPAVQPGVDAPLSRERSWVQIPSGALTVDCWRRPSRHGAGSVCNTDAPRFDSSRQL